MGCLRPVAANFRILCTFRFLSSAGEHLLTPSMLQFPVNKAVTCEDIKAKWDVICRFDENATTPTTTSDSLETVCPLVCPSLDLD